MKLAFPSEKALEDYVVKRLEEEWECPISGESVDGFVRQERLGVYGIADIIKFEWSGRGLGVTVLELKNEPLKERDVSQLCRYMTCLEKLLVKYSNEYERFSFELFGQLAGPLDPNSDLVFMLHRLENISVYDIGVCADEGFTSEFKSNVWFINGFSHKDTKPLARYVFKEIICDS